MPGTESHTTEVFRSASNLPDFVIRHVLGDQQNANIILPSMFNERRAEPTAKHNAWVVSSSPRPDGGRTLNFVAALTTGCIDTLPLFIYHGRPLDGLSPEFLQARMEEIASALVSNPEMPIPVERVFSVFAAEPVTRAFVRAWTSLTGIKEDSGDENVSSEYYAALLSYCDPQSFQRRAWTVDPERQFIVRKAKMDDLETVARLCHGFAAISAPFILSHDKATLEAQTYIKKEQLWVLEVKTRESSGIASICAVTRASARVAGITKVYTNPDYRQMGCALRLVQAVCDHYFRMEGKDSIVLYVAHDNAAARRTYKSVGFRGLKDGEGPVPGVERWLEIGFDRAKVRLGHW